MSKIDRIRAQSRKNGCKCAESRLYTFSHSGGGGGDYDNDDDFGDDDEMRPVQMKLCPASPGQARLQAETSLGKIILSRFFVIITSIMVRLSPSHYFLGTQEKKERASI